MKNTRTTVGTLLTVPTIEQTLTRAIELGSSLHQGDPEEAATADRIVAAATAEVRRILRAHLTHALDGEDQAREWNQAIRHAVHLVEKS